MQTVERRPHTRSQQHKFAAWPWAQSWFAAAPPLDAHYRLPVVCEVKSQIQWHLEMRTGFDFLDLVMMPLLYEALDGGPLLALQQKSAQRMLLSSSHAHLHSAKWRLPDKPCMQVAACRLLFWVQRGKQHRNMLAQLTSGPTYWRSSTQVLHFSGGCSVAEYCRPQV